MKLADAAANYVAHKQSMGMRFRTEARTLKSFCHAVGDVTMQDATRHGQRTSPPSDSRPEGVVRLIPHANATTLQPSASRRRPLSIQATAPASHRAG